MFRLKVDVPVNASSYVYYVHFLTLYSSSGAGELYAYAPLTENNSSQFLNVPNSRQNNDYGISVGRGLFSFRAGAWTSVAIRVKLNDAGFENGN
jgi:hypothetical protein